MNSEKKNKIDVIAYFFRTMSNDIISSKIKAIIDNMSLECTINNNGIFINLNVLDDYVLDIIYMLVVDNDHINSIHSSNDSIEQHGVTVNTTNNLEGFIRSPDNISYSDTDEFLLQLSRNYLTI